MIVTEYMENGALDRYLRVSWSNPWMYYDNWILDCEYGGAAFFFFQWPLVVVQPKIPCDPKKNFSGHIEYKNTAIQK